MNIFRPFLKLNFAILCVSEAPPNRFNSRRKSVFAEAYNPEEDDEDDNKKVCTMFKFTLISIFCVTDVFSCLLV